jgi:hypothetical protein
MVKPEKQVEILKSEDGEIKIIKYGDLIFGIGDTIRHYYNSQAQIMGFKLDYWNNMLYYYDTLTLGKEPYPMVLRDLERGKHAASVTNIVEVIEVSKETKKIADKWWKKENLRRSKLPRYEVISDYPYSQYKVGKIIEAYNTSTWTTDEHLVKWYNKYSNIFKRIN